MQTLSKLFVGCVFVLSGTVIHASELAKPYQLLAGDKPIDIGGIGYAAPFVGDFDMDGRRDLLIGQFRDGKMRIFLNEGTDQEPRFRDYIWFQDGAETGRVPTG